MALPLAVYAITSRAAESNPTMAPQDYVVQYRALSNIVWSCLATIFLCTWVSYHPNVPEPIDMKGFGLWKKLKKHNQRFFWNRLIVFVVALLVPEYILGDSLHEFFKTRSFANEHGFSLNQAFFILMGGFHRFERAGGTTRDNGIIHVFNTSNAVESARLIVSDDETPCDSLDWTEVVVLRNAGKLRIPSPTEIQDKSKNDWIAKSLVLVQTIWFIAQCIGRKAQRLPLTELEVITLGYTVVNVAIYVVWWEKPYQVAEPVRVYDNPPAGGKELEDLRDGNDEGGVALFVMGAIFGALHYLAWSSSFPNPVEQLLWRISTSMLTGLPILAGLAWLVDGVLDLTNLSYTSYNVGAVLVSTLYIAARAITLVLAFTTLRHLPPEIYRNIEWSNFLPHI